MTRVKQEVIQIDKAELKERHCSNASIVKGASYSHTDALKTQRCVTRSQSPSKSSYHLQIKNLISSTNVHRKSATSFSDYLSETDSDWGTNIDNDNNFLQLFKKNDSSVSFICDKVASSNESSYFSSPEKKTRSKCPDNKQLSLGLEAICSLDLHNKLFLSLEQRTSVENEKINFDEVKVNRFKHILNDANVDLDVLKKYAWNGVPDESRPVVWKLLLGYLPRNANRREATLSRKRNEYYESVLQTYGKGTKELDQVIWHQIHIDVLRTNPTIKLYQYETTQKSLERILYIWVIRHPASGYVQGISDLVTPFFQVFLSEYIGMSFKEISCFNRLDDDPELYDPANLPKNTLDIIEADTFWCTSKLLDGIQDNYIFAQPGIHRQIMNLKELTARIDYPLSVHLEKQGVEYIQFSFRWMNCILMREISVKNTIRMWDTYLAEGQSAFSDFHVYVCAALLVKWSSRLLKMDFQEIIIFLQSLPTQNWTYKDIEILLSEAFLWKSLFSGAKAHLR
ncbi:unnamed protein product [Pneumocystis jirovecii]|uniref:Rab-GAP TBC domain-containing protein n=1 Tax=Pneumocystis jirovecii TaxID=42068 RepID=L0PD17_PNEJI|nr:unnamed protein product [Pneumocystis jirovecii]